MRKGWEEGMSHYFIIDNTDDTAYDFCAACALDFMIERAHGTYPRRRMSTTLAAMIRITERNIKRGEAEKVVWAIETQLKKSIDFAQKYVKTYEEGDMMKQVAQRTLERREEALREYMKMVNEVLVSDSDSEIWCEDCNALLEPAWVQCNVCNKEGLSSEPHMWQAYSQGMKGYVGICTTCINTYAQEFSDWAANTRVSGDGWNIHYAFTSTKVGQEIYR